MWLTYQQILANKSELKDGMEVTEKMLTSITADCLAVKVTLNF